MVDAAGTIARINDAWRTGRVDELRPLFDPDMVIVGPKYEVMARGAEACIASYRDFLRASIIHQYKESTVSIHEAGSVAVATFAWEMEYEQSGAPSTERHRLVCPEEESVPGGPYGGRSRLNTLIPTSYPHHNVTLVATQFSPLPTAGNRRYEA